MTNQQTFDAVARHLLTQKAPALRTTEGGEVICAYRGDDGKKCAVGCLIPDDMYDAELMEGVGVHYIEDVLAPLGHSLELLATLQHIHDATLPSQPYPCDPSDWPEELGWVAKEYGLDMSVIRELA